MTTCSICKFDVPSSLSFVKCCNHMAHTNCLKNFVAKRNCCPKCTEQITQSDVVPIVFDPPQQQPKNLQNEGNSNRVTEVLNAVLERLKGYRTGTDQEEAQIRHVGEAFDIIVRTKNNENNPDKPSTSDDVAPFKQNAWDKILSIVKSKEVGFIVLALILALLCVFFWEIAVSAGALSQTTEFIGGALAALRLYAPGLAVTLFAGIKAFFTFRKT